MHRPLGPITFIVALLAACGGEATERQAAARAAAASPEQRARPVAETAEPPQTTPLVGTWDLVTEPPPAGPTAGIRMTLAFDSVRAGTIQGRVTWYFAGDVGVDPARFRPVVGQLTGDTAVQVHTAMREAGAPTFHFEGTARGDTIVLRLFAIGADTLSGGDRRWLLVRGR